MRDVTIAFDLDGTLVDTAPDLIGALNAIVGRRGIAAPPEAAMRREISFGARRMIVRAVEIAGHALAESEVEAIYAEYLVHYADNIAALSRPYPGLIAALDRLAGDGATLVVCTNKSEALARKLLAELGLAARFRALAGWDTFPVFKPDPEHLTRTIAAAGGNPRRAVMVGDSATDVKTARAAAIPVIGVPFGYTDVPMRDLAPDILIEHFDELPAAVARLTAV